MKNIGYTYTPAYYSSLQESIASICKSMLPFSLKNRRLTAAEHKLSKQQSENLKWQQSSYHQILNLMGLCKEGLVPESEVSAFRSQLIDTLIASKGAEYEQPSILKDKLIFLQELLYAKCISAEEYHASKRPLLQRLAVQGAELEARDVIVAPQTEKSEVDEWSVIDLRDDQNSVKKDNSSSKNKWKDGSSAAFKQIKDAAANLGIGSLQKVRKNRDQRSIFEVVADENARTAENPQWNAPVNESEKDSQSMLMSECPTPKSDKFVKECQGTDKGKKKTFRGLFHKEGKEVNEEGDKPDEKGLKSSRKQWGFDGIKKWKWTNEEEETTPLPLGEKSNDHTDYKASSRLVANSAANVPDTKQIKRKSLLDSPSSGFVIDKVLGDNIKKELSRIQTELSSTNPNFAFSDDQMDAISQVLVRSIWRCGVRRCEERVQRTRWGE